MAENRDDKRFSSGKIDNTLTVTPLTAYLQLLGYGDFRNGQDPAQLQDAMQAYRRLNDIPEDKTADDVARQLRSAVARDPDALARMRILASGDKPSSFDVQVLQFGLQAKGAPLQVNGQLNQPTLNALERLTALESPAAPAAPATGRTAFANATRYDPQVAEAQAYLRILGYNGKDGKQDVGPVDGNRGPSEASRTLTNAALAQFSKENKLPKDASMADVIRALKEKALSGPGLARMEDMMGKSIIGVKDQDVKAVQMALKANGLAVAATGFPDKGQNDIAALRKLKADSGASPPMPEQTPSPVVPEGADLPEIIIQPTDGNAPEIHVAPGGETAGIAPQENIIPTVVVDTPASQPSPSMEAGLPSEEGMNFAPVSEATFTPVNPAPVAAPSMSAPAEPYQVGRGPTISQRDFPVAAAPQSPAASPAPVMSRQEQYEARRTAAENRRTEGEVTRAVQHAVRGNEQATIQAVVPTAVRQIFRLGR